MPKFRKKPVEIEAVEVVDVIRNYNNKTMDRMPNWLCEAIAADGTIDVNAIDIRVHTLEGVMVGDLNDWIIRGVKGELYPCKPDIFAATYDPVS